MSLVRDARTVNRLRAAIRSARALHKASRIRALDDIAESIRSDESQHVREHRGLANALYYAYEKR